MYNRDNGDNTSYEGLGGAWATKMTWPQCKGDEGNVYIMATMAREAAKARWNKNEGSKNAQKMSYMDKGRYADGLATSRAKEHLGQRRQGVLFNYRCTNVLSHQ